MIGQKGIPGGAGGGIERHVFELALRLAKAGQTVTLYSRARHTPANFPNLPSGLTVKSLPSLHTKHLDTITHAFLATLHAIFVDRPDIVHYHGVGPSLLSWIPRLFAPSVRVVATFHCIDRLHEKWGALARQALRLGEWATCFFAEKTIVVSHTLQAYVKTAYQSDAVYIPNGAAITKKRTAPEHGAYLLSVTRLIPHKGTRELIQAFQSLSPDARHGKKLLIAGSGHYTDDYVASLKDLASSDPDILFLGAQTPDELHSLYANAYAFVHPSKTEGMPLAVLEAMEAGLPVLLSDIPEHRELGVDLRALVNMNDPHALLLSLARLLQEPADVLRERGEKNRVHVHAAYTWEKNAEKTLVLYAALIHEKQKARMLVSDQANP